MKTSKKIRIFALVTASLMLLFSVGALAADKLDQNMSGADMTFAERFAYAMQGTATGMLMVFAVLTLLAIIVSITGKLLGPKSEKKLEKTEKPKAVSTPAATPAVTESAPAPAAAESVQDDGELAAVITAAIAAMIESGDYKNEFVGGFRVVSFKRSSNGAWNRK